MKPGGKKNSLETSSATSLSPKTKQALKKLSPSEEFALSSLALGAMSVSPSVIENLIIVHRGTLTLPKGQKIQDILEQLTKAHLLTRHDDKYQASAELITHWAWELLSSSQWAELHEKTQEILLHSPRDWNAFSIEPAIARSRLAFFRGDFDDLHYHITRLNEIFGADESFFPQLVRGVTTSQFYKIPPGCWVLLLSHLDAEYRESVDLIHLLRIGDQSVLPKAVQSEPGLQILHNIIDSTLIRQDLYRGDWQAAQERAARSMGQEDCLVHALPWLQGKLSTDEFLLSYVPETGKKGLTKIKWGSFDSPIYALALLAQDTPATNQEALRLTKSEKKTRRESSSLLAYRVQLLALQRLNKSLVEWTHAEENELSHLDSLLHEIVLIWSPPQKAVNDYVFYSLPSARDAQTLKDIIRDSLDKPWLARQWLAILRRRYPKQYKHLRGDLDKSIKQNPANEISLVDLLEPKAPWEHAIDQLEQGIASVEKKTTEKESANKRLAWTLLFSECTCVIQPRVQTRKGKGYTNGRRVALQKLHKGDYPCELTPQDERIVACLQTEEEPQYYGHYTSTNYSIPLSALPLLQGHPALLDEHTLNPLRIEFGTPQVSLLQNKTGFVLEPTPRSSRSVSFNRQGSVVTTYTLTKEQENIFEILIHLEEFPPEALARAREMLERISSLVLCVDERGALGDIEEVPAEGTVTFQLTPSKGTLDIALLVRPLGENGPAFAPGLGPEQVVHKSGPLSQVCHRNLLQEEHDALQLLLVSPVLTTLAQESNDHHYQFTISELESMLELVSTLAEKGIKVQWPEGEPLRIHVTGCATVSVSSKSNTDWLDAQITMPINGQETLNHATLLAAAQGNRRFIPLSDGSYAKLEKSLLNRIQRLSAFQLDEKNAQELHAFAALELESDAAWTIEGDATWVQRKTDFKEAFSKTVRIPRTLNATLRDYQVEGIRWAIRLSRIHAGACLADDMGLGKTIQTLAVLLSRASDGPALVVAPTSVIGNWEKEVKKFAPSLSVLRLSDVPAQGEEGRKLPLLKKKEILLTTYDLAYREIKSLTTITWSTLVLDEAQAIKNPEARRTRAIGTLSARFKLALSGTPIENHLGELWSLFHIVNPGLLGTRQQFVRRFQTPIERGASKVATKQLQTLITPFVLRRTKAEVLDTLPPRTELTLDIELSEAERDLYEATRREAVSRLKENSLEAKKNPIQILAELTRLRMLACHPRLAFPQSQLGSAKHEALMNLLQELHENGHRALLFSQFVKHLALVKERMDASNLDYLYLDGSTKTKDREKRVDEFQEGKASFFLISLKAGGVGLNLTAADYVIHLDPWWNPAVEDQASDRIHRIGQTRPVTIYRLIAKNTIEEKLIALHEKKRNLADQILSEAGTSGRMSADELLKIISS